MIHIKKKKLGWPGVLPKLKKPLKILSASKHSELASARGRIQSSFLSQDARNRGRSGRLQLSAVVSSRLRRGQPVFGSSFSVVTTSGGADSHPRGVFTARYLLCLTGFCLFFIIICDFDARQENSRLFTTCASCLSRILPPALKK